MPVYHMRATAVASAKCAMSYWVLLHVMMWAVLISYPNDAWRSWAEGRPLQGLLYGLLTVVNALTYRRICFSDPGYITETASEKEVDMGEESVCTTDFSSVRDDADIERQELEPMAEHEPCASHMCKICKMEQPVRSKHCLECRRCVAKYDHHCFWIGTCVGERNHSLFWQYLLFQTIEAWWAFSLGYSALQQPALDLKSTYVLISN
eukprot:TRINITY_DN5356_c0_g1_i4.p1 TRINITY_DN5356_c0_g1~~TRINITY_DN5356_c0_g1_i4.p1  ORF type:complete len:207 (-),score=39.57 TRINITY_DN5356_c0_g1_i4:452-1072(-)